MPCSERQAPAAVFCHQLSVLSCFPALGQALSWNPLTRLPQYRDTSLIRNIPLLGPYSGTLGALVPKSAVATFIHTLHTPHLTLYTLKTKIVGDHGCYICF